MLWGPAACLSLVLARYCEIPVQWIGTGVWYDGALPQKLVQNPSPETAQIPGYIFILNRSRVLLIVNHAQLCAMRSCPAEASAL